VCAWLKFSVRVPDLCLKLSAIMCVWLKIECMNVYMGRVIDCVYARLNLCVCVCVYALECMCVCVLVRA